jgi:hypothetical protein
MHRCQHGLVYALRPADEWPGASTEPWEEAGEILGLWIDEIVV